MGSENIFERNISALSVNNPRLASRLSARTASTNRYTFTESRNGEIIPAIAAAGGGRSLHSAIDPKREAQRLISTITDDTGFVVFLGLGGGFAPEAALEMTAAQVLVIDFDIDGIAELFSSIDYTKLLGDDRFSLLIDPAENEIKKFVTERYQPALCGGIKTIPLRTRTEPDINKFDSAAAAIKDAIDNVAADYSVQAHFGSRWFSNIIRNIAAETECGSFTAGQVHTAAIVAAGPSLDQQLPLLAECKSIGVFVISSDTALPVLLHNGIEPDAVVSIDCQHISYYHFMGCNLRGKNIPLFLDIASPPLLSRLSPSPLFFSSGHPLALYVSQHWRPLQRLDTSGGNVTYACLSLAETLGAQKITLFGADFAYVNSRSYARGTYIFPFFERKQMRLSPMETFFSRFLYRSEFLEELGIRNEELGMGKQGPESNEQLAGRIDGEKRDYYETAQLRFYRERLEEKAAAMSAWVIAAEGQGAPVKLPLKVARNVGGGNSAVFDAGKAKMSGLDFLEWYRAKAADLPAANAKNYMQSLDAEEREIFITLLPLAAAVKKREPLLKTADLIEETKHYCAAEIERVLAL